MTDVIEFDRVSKRYLLGNRMNAREAVMRAVTRPFRPVEEPTELWSLRDVSFSLAAGESLGIVGANGAGKSTVLKILAEITSPTIGTSRTRGRVAPLLEVGTGFHPELTGRENVYLNGAVLGMSRKDITRHFDQIVEFSGVARFLDTPVKRYSSGMYLRLAFAVAAHLEPDVLVVDEILAVGDAEFQRKCIGRMQEAEQEGRTLVFVSHDLESLTRLCPRALWLERGQVRELGSTHQVVRNYLRASLSATEDGASATWRAGPVTVHRVTVRPEARGATTPDTVLLRTDPLAIEVDLEVGEALPGLDLALYLTNDRGVRVLDQTLSDGSHYGSGSPTDANYRLSVGRHLVRLSIPPMLNVGDFTAGLWLGTPHEELLDEPSACTFTLHGSDHGRPDRVVTTSFPFGVVDLSDR